MSYSTSLPGISEARLDAIKTLVVNSLTDLNAALARDALTPLVWTAAQVVLGDPARITTSVIAVYAGGEDNAVDVDVKEFMSSLTYEMTLSTNIDVWLHPDAGAAYSDPLLYAAFMERAMARTLDHLRWRVFCAKANYSLALGSQETGAADTFTEARVDRVIKGVTEKGFGDSTRCYFGRIVHRATIHPSAV